LAANEEAKIATNKSLNIELKEENPSEESYVKDEDVTREASISEPLFGRNNRRRPTFPGRIECG
jgi:hypothetical protein